MPGPRLCYAARQRAEPFRASPAQKKAPLSKGDSPQCGEMSRSDRGARARRAGRVSGLGDSDGPCLIAHHTRIRPGIPPPCLRSAPPFDKGGFLRGASRTPPPTSLPCQREVPSVSEAEGFLPGCGVDGVLGKARQNPSGRLRRPPPFDKGGFSAGRDKSLPYGLNRKKDMAVSCRGRACPIPTGCTIFQRYFRLVVQHFLQI